MPPKIIINYTNVLKGILYLNNSYGDTGSSAIVILTDGKYFRCLKNRYDTPHDNEFIPNSLLTAYLMRYESHFSKQDLIDALVYETTS
jgi:hypothetical protein